jgi:ABC-2 type transport system permease protein
MFELWLVLEREFVQRVRSRSFLLSTALVPLFMLAIFGIPLAMEVMGEGGRHHVVVVDEAPAAVGEQVVAALSAEPVRRRDAHFEVERLRAPLAAVRDSLNAAVAAEAIDGYLWLPPDVVAGGRVAYRARNVTDFEVQQRLGAIVSQAVQAVRLGEAGLQIGEVASLLQPVRVEASRITRDGADGASGAATFLLSIIAGFLLYFLILFYGAQVMQSVQEEKTNRISEVLVSSIRAPYLMMGKVLGVGSAALLQVAIWGVFGALLVSQRERLAGAVGAAPGTLGNLSLSLVDPVAGVSILLFALFGFFLYAALFAAAGAAAASSEDAQRFTFPLITPLILPMLLQQQIIRDPQGTLATFLGWLPLTSPIVMPMRMGSGTIHTPEIAGALLTLLAGVALLGWVAGKIYRVGILATGKRPTLRELGRWLRTA